VLSDAPEAYVSQLMQAIVGLEITLTQWSGKWKVSQNQPVTNREGVVAGLRAEGSEAAHAVAQLVPR
jgi:transcriptional regulator